MTKLSRKKAHRRSLIRNLATSLILYEEIDTTLAKAKALKPVIERIISRTKPLDLQSKRAAYSFFFDRNAAKKLINEIVPRYSERNSGYVRIIKLSNRPGDNSQMARIELVDKKVFLPEEDKETAEPDNKAKADAESSPKTKKAKKNSKKSVGEK